MSIRNRQSIPEASLPGEADASPNNALQSNFDKSETSSMDSDERYLVRLT